MSTQFNINTNISLSDLYQMDFIERENLKKTYANIAKKRPQDTSFAAIVDTIDEVERQIAQQREAKMAYDNEMLEIEELIIDHVGGLIIRQENFEKSYRNSIARLDSYFNKKSKRLSYFDRNRKRILFRFYSKRRKNLLYKHKSQSAYLLKELIETYYVSFNASIIENKVYTDYVREKKPMVWGYAFRQSVHGVSQVHIQFNKFLTQMVKLYGQYTLDDLTKEISKYVK